MPRNDHGADLEPLGDFARVHAAGAAEREEREPARIVTTLDRHDADRAFHVGVGDAHDPFRQLEHGPVSAARPGPRRRAVVRPASSDILPPKKKIRIEPPEQQVRVGHRQLGARAVADWPRHRPSAPRTDAEARRRCPVRNRPAAARQRCECRSPAGGPENLQSASRSRSPRHRRSGSRRWTCRPCRTKSPGGSRRRAPRPSRRRRRPPVPRAPVRTALARAAAADIDPPFDCMMARRDPSKCRSSVDRYRSMSGVTYALTTVVLQRSNSRYSGSTSCDAETCHPDFAQPSAMLPLVRGIHIGVQQADGDDVGALIFARDARADRSRSSSSADDPSPPAPTRSSTPNVSCSSTIGLGSGTKRL